MANICCHAVLSCRHSVRGTLLLFLTLVAPGLGQENASTASDAVQARGRLRVATCQFPVSGDVAANAEWIRTQMREAKQQEADIAHFSEAALSGYAGTDYKSLKGFDWDSQRAEVESILALARSLRMWVVLGAAHQLSGSNKPHNSLYVINNDGELIDRYDKRFCTGGDLRHYSPGDHFVTFDVNNANADAAQRALRDVATFLGFTDTDIYLNTLTRERQDIFQPITDKQERQRCLIRREADAAKQQCPELTERIDDAVILSVTHAVEIVDDHAAHVISTSHEMGTIYQVIDNRCGCSDAQDHAPDGLCQHRLAVDLTRRVQALLTQPS